MIVIDTHALVWLVQGDPRLGATAREIIEESRSLDGVYIPAIVPWEIAMLVDKDRVSLGLAVDAWFGHILASPGFRLAPLELATAIDAGLLPGSIHGDPGDRIVIATARGLHLPVLTADEKILAYAAAGHVGAIDARA
ncbi:MULTISPECIES: type II toxin-antitoxin system VapC family toxin [Sphingomonas]|jgi:PIN domain nuclease of toxin-antitoxin system|uniref:type II toxin-antitoxin system VapC family toxin n=1 Tax=Sphingomonas TaxID=13687 RepID=UPI0008336444|nr:MULTISPECIES: type II toxin-antitoxin system VapC family toxin [Sphingomonas]MBY0301656.1 type II toxin-antitoxin system VapC family toxin [Sphingomonas ginsenosidimutans]